MANKNKNKIDPRVKDGEISALFKSLVHTIVLVMISFFTLVFVSTAWFASNSNVNSGTAPISAEFEPIKLAVSSKDIRTISETKVLRLDGQKLSDGHILKDQKGNTIVDENGNSFFYTNNGTIALRLESDDVKVSPGKRGEITFYVVPEKDGAQSVNLYLVLAGYRERKDQSGKIVGGSKIEDIVLNNLLSGHILLFQERDKSGKLSNWISGTVNDSGVVYIIYASNPNAMKDEPWPITVYWEWPLRYENMVNDYNGQLNGLISSTYYEVIGVPGYKYNQVFLTKETDISGNDEKKSDAYNQADEYIGKTADDLYVSIQIDLVE